MIRILRCATAPPAPSHQSPTEGSSREELLAFAETLGIPWRRLHPPGDRGGAEAAELPARRRGRLPARVGAHDPVGRRRAVMARSRPGRDPRLSGPCVRREARDKGSGVSSGILAGDLGPDPSALARHCGFAYQRILLLQRVRRAAARSRGTTAERLAFVCSAARCSFEDAAWALGEEECRGGDDAWRPRSARCAGRVSSFRERRRRRARFRSCAGSCSRPPNPNFETRLQDTRRVGPP